jgi:hypothetical protein
MSERFSEKKDSRKLAHAYVALALAKDVANGYVREQPGHAVLHPLLSMLDVTSRLIEEVLENALPQESQKEELTEDSLAEERDSLAQEIDSRLEYMSLVCSEMLM